MRFSLLSVTFLSATVAAQTAGSYLLGSYFGIPLTNGTYDYVVVGGGTAGLVVATRLAENPNVTDAVVEPGSFYEISNGNQRQIPFLSTKYVSVDPMDVQPLIDWGLLTVPQPVSLNWSLKVFL